MEKFQHAVEKAIESSGAKTVGCGGDGDAVAMETKIEGDSQDEGADSQVEENSQAEDDGRIKRIIVIPIWRFAQ